MKNNSIQIYTFKERVPKHGEQVWLLVEECPDYPLKLGVYLVEFPSVNNPIKYKDGYYEVGGACPDLDNHYFLHSDLKNFKKYPNVLN